MVFESKKIIENSQVGAHNGSFFKHFGLFLVMFGVGVLLVIGGIKGYSYVGKIIGGDTGTGSVLSVHHDGNPTQGKIINALVIGVGGEGHRGAYNTDTMIVVSYNPRTKQLNMISIPRDLYVNIDKGYYNRINSILDYYMSQKKLSLDEALVVLKQKVGNLIGQDIPYYGLIDFKGFEHIIDTLGGVKVNVPEELYDTTFPIDEFNVGTLHIESGVQMMDGTTALNYARSRHSTSDFDRSRRQQIVIKALLDKLLSFGSIGKIKSLYTDFHNTVTTNVGLSTIAQYLPYATRISSLNTIVFQSDCPENINQMRHGCVLYSPSREAFGGAAVLLPIGATPRSISDYSQLFKFVNRVIYFPFGDFKDTTLSLYNGIDKSAVPQNIAGFSSSLGVELIRNGLKINNVSNNQIKHDKNLLIQFSGSLSQKQFASYATIIEDILDIGPIDMLPSDQLSSVFSGEVETGTTMLLLVGKDAVLRSATKK